MTEKQAKMGEKQESMAETNQKWQKKDKNEKLEAAKAAWLVYYSLLSLTGSFLALLGLT